MGDVGPVLWLLMGTIAIVLLIACANVANLLLVRAEGRRQELTVRAALGAGWGHITRHLLVESVTLGVVGGALGLGLAYVGLELLVAAGPASLPRLSEISIDVRVLAFTLAVSVGSALLFGLVPVVRYAAPRRGLALGDAAGSRTVGESRTRQRSQNAPRRTTARPTCTYFSENFDDPLSDFRAEALLDFMIRELGPPVYNQGVRDACRFIQDRLGDIEGEVYEPDSRK